MICTEIMAYFKPKKSYMEVTVTQLMVLTVLVVGTANLFMVTVLNCELVNR